MIDLVFIDGEETGELPAPDIALAIVGLPSLSQARINHPSEPEILSYLLRYKQILQEIRFTN